MTLRELASEIAKEEGKKHQAVVGDVREIISVISDIMYKGGGDFTQNLARQLYKNGERRSKKSI